VSLYCDVALPVPLDQTFTYELVETLQHRVQPGARVLAPFGPRKLTGVVVRCHDEPPEQKARQILRLIDEEPALTDELLGLGRWVADYYCAPIGETLKSMLPLGVEIKETKVVRLTPKGAEAAAQFSGAVSADDPVVVVLRALEKRALNLPYFKRKFPESQPILRSLERKGYLTIAVEVEERDPLRARDGRLVVSPGDPAKAPAKPNKGERWLLEYLANHPGEHDIESLAVERKDVSRVAKKLAQAGAVAMKVVRKPPARVIADRAVALNETQQAAFDAVAASIRSGAYRAFLLHGVTGSGKTEVYLRCIDAALEAGKTAMLLVPEIALTPQVASQFFARFGDQVAILHSAFTGWQRSEQWRRIRSGEARVVVGTRSGVFAPVSNLGLVVVDEEHESSYKQEETPRYHGRNVAIVRAAEAGATVLLGSATPSLESRYNVELGKYELLSMPERIESRPMPAVEVVDMRQEFLETRRKDMFSRALLDQLQQKLEAREQTMVLLNRRGFSMYVMCRKCGERIQCENCSVTLTFHRREQRLLCHYCDYAAPVPNKCPSCSSEFLDYLGSGSEKVEDELRRLFPKARIARLDRDTVKGRDHYETVLHAFREHRYDILVGTQMIAKGHDIPNVTLVGVVSADVGLGIPDFRAAERTFQLLTQVSGRAGRGALPGKVVMQTFEPDHYAVRMAAAQDYDAFYEKEIYYRRQMHYPPFAAMAIMLVRSQKLEEALTWSGRLGRQLQDRPEGVYMQGPAAALVHKLKTEYRYQFLLKARQRSVLGKVLRKARAYAQAEGWPPTALILDVDPMSLL
jgi:primosomal protein N' (replication factor Y)